MTRRDSQEPHRAATPLELLFDLVSVIAIAAAAAGLHHAIADAHVLEGLVKFLCAFFAIWWAWMNYTWFASAYDNDDTLFRLLTMLIMAGALTMAAGIGAFFDALELKLLVIGYVIMRFGMVGLWLRAAAGDPDGRRTAISYAAGITVVQLYWVGFMVSLPLETTTFYALLVAGIIAELAVPVIAETKGNTPWHRHHIIERYGLLNIIVLGETLLAASIALQSSAEHVDYSLIRIAVSALLILFSMWWLYFSKEEHLETEQPSRAFAWGYGHSLIYASGAAVGAGIAVAVDVAMDHAQVSPVVGSFAIAIPIAVYMAGLWFVRDRVAINHIGHYVLLVFAVVVLLAPLFPFALEAIAAITVLCAVVRSSVARRVALVG